MHRMNGWLLTVTLALALTSPLRADEAADKPSAPADPTAPRPELTLATYNVNYGLTGEAALKLVVDNIRKTKGDVVAIQEGNDKVWVYLRRHLGRDYPHMKFHRSPLAAGGMGWLSKHQLLRHRVVPSREKWFDATLAEVRLGSRTVVLANVHLCPTAVPRDATLSTAMKAVAQSEEIRQREIGDLASKLPADTPVIILGDLNSLPGFAATQFLVAKGYTDSYASARPDKKFQPTWEGRLGGRKWPLRLDYIYHTADLVTLDSRVIEAGPSDHFPVVSRVALRKAPTSRPASRPAK